MSLEGAISTVEVKGGGARKHEEEQTEGWLTMRVGEQVFAIPVLEVQGVLRRWEMSEVPLSPPEVVGAMNLRGRIVTVLDLGVCLGMSVDSQEEQRNGVVVERGQFLYCFLVGEVGEALSIPTSEIIPPPSNLDAKLRDYATGVYRQKKHLIVLLSLEQLLQYEE